MDDTKHTGYINCTSNTICNIVNHVQCVCSVLYVCTKEVATHVVRDVMICAEIKAPVE